MFLLIGPSGGTITGQSQMFNLIVERLGNSKCIDIANDRCLFSFLRNIIKCWFSFNVEATYFTVSRTKLGMYRDLLYLLPFLLLGKRIIGHIHGSEFLDFHLSLSVFQRRLFKFLYSNVDILIVLIDDMKEEVRSTGYKGRIITIENCISD